MQNRLIYLCLLSVLLFGVTYAQQDDTDHSAHSTEHTQGEAEQHDGNHHEEQASNEANTANVVTVGDVEVHLDPMISVEGQAALGLTFSQTAAYDLTVTTSSGETVGEVAGEGERAILNVDQLQAGTYSVSGALGDETLSTTFAVYEGVTASGTQIVSVLAPSPSISRGGLSEVFVYGFAGGENVHKPYLVSRQMPGMTHMDDDQMLEAQHNHFDEYEVSFKPAANETPVSFPMVGTWQMSVALGGNEKVSFDVDVTQ